MSKLMKYFTILFLAILCVVAVDAQTWNKVDGTSSYINAIFIPDNSGKIYVSSDVVPTDLQQNDVKFPNYGVGQNGFRISTDKGKTWGDTLLKDYSVFAFYSYPKHIACFHPTIQ